MKPQHTPGPWLCSEHCVVRAEANDTPIAFPRLPDPRDLGAEEKSNLRLCAAARPQYAIARAWPTLSRRSSSSSMNAATSARAMRRPPGSE